jgi:Ca-activated chloride channel family protein
VLRTPTLALFASIALTFALTAPTARAQVALDSRASHVVIPSCRAFPLVRGLQPILIESVSARVKIVEHVAETTLDVALRNPGGTAAEAILLLPIPAGAAVSAFAFEGGAPEPTARLLPEAEARRLYDSIVAQTRDPALLEFAGYQLIRSSLFPVPAGATQRVRLTWESILEADGSRIDYALPRSESIDARCPWHIAIDFKSSSPISTVYSPSHEIRSRRAAPGHFLADTGAEAARIEPGPFLFSAILEQTADGVTASLFAYPDLKAGGGYFLLVAGLPADIDSRRRQALSREVILVIDRSGSMAGKKMDQVKAAALQVIEGLADGEAFNIVDYSSAVALFAPRPVVKEKRSVADARAYLAALRPTGGTNIHDALIEALRQDREGSVPRLGIVLFLTDGLPTVGRTRESEIRELVEKANPHHRRVFTFGVGSDVNAPLLDRVADATRAKSTYVLPQEDVEVKVGDVFRQLYGPVLASPVLETIGSDGAVSTRRVRELVPALPADLFDGDRLVVLGQFVGLNPIDFRLSGNFLGAPRTFAFRFNLGSATTRNAFVPRLWATRRIAELVDQIRQAGADAAGGLSAIGSTVFADPRLRELSDEIVRLSTEFGVLSEYTAFLATEGTDLADMPKQVEACQVELEKKAVHTRSGVAGLNQSLNIQDGKLKAWRNYSNSFVDENLNRVEVSGVRQVCDRTFFRRGDRWVDAQTLVTGLEPIAASIVEFGSAEHGLLIDKLVKENRQGVLSLPADTLLRCDGKNVLVRNGGQ